MRPQLMQGSGIRERGFRVSCSMMAPKKFYFRTVYCVGVVLDPPASTKVRNAEIITQAFRTSGLVVFNDFQNIVSVEQLVEHFVRRCVVNDYRT